MDDANAEGNIQSLETGLNWMIQAGLVEKAVWWSQMRWL